MKLVCLNTWGARAGIKKLLDFFEMYKDVDIFCLQEVWNGGEHMVGKTAAGRSMDDTEPRLLEKISAALPHHAAYFCSQFYDFFGLALFVKKDFPVLETGEHYIYRERGYISSTDIADHGRPLQYVTLETASGPRTVINLHAAWQPGGKTDTPERLLQSERILAFTQTLTHPSVLAGDFNLLPQTTSIERIELAGWNNLIKAFEITSTRTRLYTKADRFADYIFTSKQIQVHEFRVLPQEVSDHAPLFLSFT